MINNKVKCLNRVANSNGNNVIRMQEEVKLLRISKFLILTKVKNIHYKKLKP